MRINWTKNGLTGIASNGWMIYKSDAVFHVFNPDDILVGQFHTREGAEQAVKG